MITAPLSVSGAQILDANGSPVRLAGVNWGGAQQDGIVPAGLDKLNRNAIAERVAGWGLNHVRFPFALGSFVNNDGTLKTGAADAAALAANTDLVGQTPWEVYQACVTALTSAGLAVIPNQMLLFPGWCCAEADNNGLWYNGNWPASTFAACWTLVASALASNPLVIGYDLHNEPRPASVGGKTLTPSWGDGDAATDMQAIYSSTAAALRVISGSKLFFCEGLSYAGDLTEAGAHPVTGPDVVYSLHDYSWYHTKGQTLTDYYNQMDANGGYLMLDGTAPLYIGEFGQNLDTAANMSTGWLPQFLSYCNARTLHWCWWELSAQMVLGTQPVTNIVRVHPGDQESYGLMQGQDWLGDQTEMLALLQAIM